MFSLCCSFSYVIVGFLREVLSFISLKDVSRSNTTVSMGRGILDSRWELFGGSWFGVFYSSMRCLLWCGVLVWMWMWVDGCLSDSHLRISFAFPSLLLTALLIFLYALASISGTIFTVLHTVDAHCTCENTRNVHVG